MTASSPLIKSKRVILVEDSIITQDILQLAMQNRGHKITMAADARSAVEILCGHEFDIALIDFNLPDKNGIELVTEFLARNKQAMIPRLVALTGDAHDVIQLDKHSQHFDLIISKPFQIADLVDVVESQSSKPRPAFSPRSFLASKSPPPEPVFVRHQPYHIIYFPYDFYSSFKNAVSMSVARNGTVDAIILDEVPNANDRLTIANLKGLDSAAIIDRTGKLEHQSAMSASDSPEFEQRLAKVLAHRKEKRADIRPELLNSRDLTDNLLIQLYLRESDLVPKVDLSSPTGYVYNHILPVPNMLEVVTQLTAQGLLVSHEHDALHRCPTCGSARIYPHDLCSSLTTKQMLLVCTDCHEQLTTAQIERDFMQQYSLTEAARSYLLRTPQSQLA